MSAGCSSGGSDGGDPSAQKVTGGPTEDQKKAMNEDQIAAASNKSVPTYSAPPMNAPQGTGYRIAPANPNDPHFKPDPKLAGGH